VAGTRGVDDPATETAAGAGDTPATADALAADAGGDWRVAVEELDDGFRLEVTETDDEG
jgi:hypothetical protein